MSAGLVVLLVGLPILVGLWLLVRWGVVKTSEDVMKILYGYGKGKSK